MMVKARDANTGNNIAVVARLDVISVRKFTAATNTIKRITKGTLFNNTI
ncbi:MAG: hypothetical protein R2769_02020 [Saprospiraceae bacterium]